MNLSSPFCVAIAIFGHKSINFAYFFFVFELFFYASVIQRSNLFLRVEMKIIKLQYKSFYSVTNAINPLTADSSKHIR